MSFPTAKTTALALILCGSVTLGTGCEPKGPAEQAGASVDKGVQNVKDAVNPPGNAEKAGRAVDNAINK